MQVLMDTELGASYRLTGSLNLATLQARSANLQTLHRLIDDSLNWLQVGQPASFIVRVEVRTEERIVQPRHRSFATNITTLSHASKFPKMQTDMLNFLPSNSMILTFHRR
jgi:hypothetical protein